jgi:hypothetical protein
MPCHGSPSIPSRLLLSLHHRIIRDARSGLLSRVTASSPQFATVQSSPRPTRSGSRQTPLAACWSILPATPLALPNLAAVARSNHHVVTKWGEFVKHGRFSLSSPPHRRTAAAPLHLQRATTTNLENSQIHHPATLPIPLCLTSPLPLLYHLSPSRLSH